MRTLDHSPADIVRWLLVAKSLGSAWNASPQLTWPVYAAGEPPKPDNVITIYDTTGISHGSVMTDGELQGHYGFQIMVRALDHPTGFAKANRIRATLAQSVDDVTVSIPHLTAAGSALYVVQNIAQIGDVISLGANVPNEKTFRFSLNAVVNVDQTGGFA